MSIITFGLFALSVGVFYIYDAIMSRVAKKNETSEQQDESTEQKIKLNRYFVENISVVSIGRVYWKNVKTSYRKDGFIFIHMLSDACLVIPERALNSKTEAAEVADFIKMQIANNKRHTP
ncbi:hypothetical protein AO703_09445 [[Enterobacter] lignolyticus]|uniref:YcxB-like protein domain-containing protein n=2 Tax=[Enterobacter] lignolyticus TaxID=1334193 RepID=A0A806XJN4_9ENTR|nr:hypothetical protein AO703_09445 [[Enterobacter] lignolyticus]